MCISGPQISPNSETDVARSPFWPYLVNPRSAELNDKSWGSKTARISESSVSFWVNNSSSKSCLSVRLPVPNGSQRPKNTRCETVVNRHTYLSKFRVSNVLPVVTNITILLRLKFVIFREPYTDYQLSTRSFVAIEEENAFFILFLFNWLENNRVKISNFYSEINTSRWRFSTKHATELHNFHLDCNAAFKMQLWSISHC